MREVGLLCDFCDGNSHEHVTPALIMGHQAAICWDCVEACLNVIRWQHRDEFERIVERVRAFEIPERGAGDTTDGQDSVQASLGPSDLSGAESGVVSPPNFQP